MSNPPGDDHESRDVSRDEQAIPHWPGRAEGLKQREAEVLALITQGRTNAEIAALMYLSENTVKSYVRQLYRKIGVASRTQAVLWASRNGFLPDHHAWIEG